jgi:peptide/nickel transport system substrate-binding protein
VFDFSSNKNNICASFTLLSRRSLRPTPAIVNRRFEDSQTKEEKMRRTVSLAITALVVLSFLVGCAQVTPTAAPTKPSAPAVTIAPSASTVAPAAATAPVAATKPAATAPTVAPAAKIKRGGILKSAYFNDWGTADHHLDVSVRYDQQVHSEALFEMRMNDKTKRFDLTPSLVESWEQTDPKTVVLKLQKGVKFHDGSDWNTEGAKWNLLRMRDHPQSSAKDQAGSIASIDIVDATTMKLNLKEASVSALWRLSSAYATRPMIISKQAADKNGEDYLKTHYIGTGPFEMVDWKTGDRQTFKKFAQYWRKAPDGQSLPYLDGVELRFIPDSNVALVELRTGNVHFVVQIQGKDLATVKNDPALVVQGMPWEVAGYKLNLNATAGPFKDNLKLRQAVQYSMDRVSIAKTLGLGAGSPLTDIIPEGQFGYSASQPRYGYDLEKAKQLMKDAGAADGLDISLLAISRQPDRAQSEVVQSMMAKAGIRAKIELMDKIAILAKIRNKEFDANTQGHEFTLTPYIALARVNGCKGQSNWTNWCNEPFEACLAEMDREPDDVKRAGIVMKCAQIIHDSAYYVYLWTQDRYDAHTNKLHGWTPYHQLLTSWSEMWLE